MFDPIWMPTWFHFGSLNQSKCVQKMILANFNMLIDVGIDFVASPIVSEIVKKKNRKIADVCIASGRTLGRQRGS